MVRTATELPSVMRDIDRPRRRRRWAPVVVAALGVLAVAFGIFAATFVASYQPLQADPGGANSGVTGPVRKLGSFQPPGDRRPFVAYLAPYRDGRVIGLGFTIVNREWFPVTVLQIGGSGGDPLRQLSVGIGSDRDFGTSPPSQPATSPFRPFTVTGRSATYVLVRYRFVGCSGDTVLVANVVVTYRAFGVTHRVPLALPYSLRVDGREGCS